MLTNNNKDIEELRNTIDTLKIEYNKITKEIGYDKITTDAKEKMELSDSLWKAIKQLEKEVEEMINKKE